MVSLRTAGLAVFAALLVAGLALAGCGDSAGFDAGPISAQTTEALDLLPADAALVGMVDFAAARQSGSVGPMLDGPMSPFGHDGGDMEDFVRLTGFDPATDLDRVYVAGSPDRDTGALVVLARFDRDRVERALTEEAGDELVRSDVEGVPFWAQAESGGALALPNDRMMLAGTEAAVRGMLERMARGTQGLSADGAFMALAEKARHRDDAWFVARATASPMGGDMGGLGDLAETTVVSLDFRDSGLALDAYLVPRPGAAAGDVADVARGAVSAARVEADDTPGMMDMLDGVDIDEEGPGVRVTATVPQAMLDTSARG